MPLSFPPPPSWPGVSPKGGHGSGCERKAGRPRSLFLAVCTLAWPPQSGSTNRHGWRFGYAGGRRPPVKPVARSAPHAPSRKCRVPFIEMLGSQAIHTPDAAGNKWHGAGDRSLRVRTGGRANRTCSPPCRRCPTGPRSPWMVGGGHGFRFAPGAAAHDPASATSWRWPRPAACWKAVSWPRHPPLDRPGAGLWHRVWLAGARAAGPGCAARLRHRRPDDRHDSMYQHVAAPEFTPPPPPHHPTPPQSQIPPPPPPPPPYPPQFLREHHRPFAGRARGLRPRWPHCPRGDVDRIILLSGAEIPRSRPQRDAQSGGACGGKGSQRDQRPRTRPLTRCSG